MENKQLQLVTFEQAKRLKEAGFDWPVDRFFVDIEDVPSKRKTAFPFWCANPAAYPKEPTNWNALKIGGKKGNTSAPTVALALKWMRYVKKMRAYVMSNSFEHWGHASTGTMGTQTDIFKNYESAESALLDELLTLIEN